MNPLDSLKDKLRIKPIVDEFKPISVIPSTYVAPNAPEKVKISKVTVTDKRDTQFDIKELMKRLEDKKLSKITIKSTVKLAPEAPKILEEPEQIESPKKKVKKSAKNPHHSPPTINAMQTHSPHARSLAIQHNPLHSSKHDTPARL